jgi:hypothetical protein
MAMSRSPSRLVPLVLAGTVLGLASGCGQGPKLVPVTGTVLYRGQPLAGATVVFVPRGEPSGPALLATGLTDAEGRFSLRTHVGPAVTREGAVPGGHRVTVSKFVPPGGMTEEEYQQKVAAAGQAVYSATGSVPAKVQLVPPRYSDSQKTELAATVTAGGNNDFPFDLR